MRIKLLLIFTLIKINCGEKHIIDVRISNIADSTISDRKAIMDALEEISQTNISE